MSGLLEDRVTLYVHDHPGVTVEQVARALRARDKTVRGILQSPLFIFSTRGQARGYFLRSVAGDGRGRAVAATRETDCDFLQRVLSDGRAHNLNEILRRSFADRGCGLTVHSRAHDLRKKFGLDVVNWKDGERGEGSWYRLNAADHPTAEAPAAPPGFARPVTAPSGSPTSSDSPLTEPGGTASPKEDAFLPTPPRWSAGSAASPGSVSGPADSLPPSRSDGAAQLSLTGPAFRKQAAA